MGWIDPSEWSEEEQAEYLRNAEAEVEAAYPGLDKMSEQCYAIVGFNLYDNILKWEKESKFREILMSEMPDEKYKDAFEKLEDYLTGAEVPDAIQGTAAYLRIATATFHVFAKLQGYDPITGEKISE